MLLYVLLMANDVKCALKREPDPICCPGSPEGQTCPDGSLGREHTFLNTHMPLAPDSPQTHTHTHTHTPAHARTHTHVCVCVVACAVGHACERYTPGSQLGVVWVQEPLFWQVSVPGPLRMTPSLQVTVRLDPPLWRRL